MLGPAVSYLGNAQQGWVEWLPVKLRLCFDVSEDHGKTSDSLAGMLNQSSLVLRCVVGSGQYRRRGRVQRRT